MGGRFDRLGHNVRSARLLAIRAPYFREKCQWSDMGAEHLSTSLIASLCPFTVSMASDIGRSGVAPSVDRKIPRCRSLLRWTIPLETSAPSRSRVAVGRSSARERFASSHSSGVIFCFPFMPNVALLAEGTGSAVPDSQEALVGTVLLLLIIV